MAIDRILEYYREQSVFTDPGRYAEPYAELPWDVSSPTWVVQGLLIPPYADVLRNLYHVDPDAIDNQPFGPFGPRRVEDLLDRI
jgi:hypothetical protein